MIHHFLHVLLGIGAFIGGLGIIIGWILHIIYHRIRHGKDARQ